MSVLEALGRYAYWTGFLFWVWMAYHDWRSFRRWTKAGEAYEAKLRALLERERQQAYGDWDDAGREGEGCQSKPFEP